MTDEKRRHPQVVNVQDVAAREQTKGRFSFKGKRLWPEAGGKQLACSWFEVPAGKQAFPHHFHSAFEEALYVLEGTGVARIGEERVTIGPGDYIAYPAGPATAHSLTNTGAGPLRYLCMSTISTLDIVGYPDSKKVAIASGIDAAKGILRSDAWVKMLVRDQPSLDYYDGEDTGEES